MASTEENQTNQVGNIIGWCVLAAGIAQLPVIVAGYFVTQVLPRPGLSLLLFPLSSGLLLIAGGIGLIWRKHFGYYCVYLATFFGGIGGFKYPFVPFVKRFLNIGPATEDLFLALNLLLVAVLVREHWRRIVDVKPSMQRAHRTALVLIAVLGIVWVSIGRAMIHRERGSKGAASEIPVVGASFSGFETSGELPYISVETKIQRRIIVVFSGTCTEEAVQALAAEHRLKKMDQPEAHKKFLPQVKAWKLKEPAFPVKFSEEDGYYVGRLKEMPKVTLQIVHRKSDRRFTAQVFGVSPTE